MNSLKQELNVLRDRIEYLEKLLSLNEPPAENLNRKSCAFCENQHPIWKCSYFKYLQVADRWKVAKKQRLCYRCLDNISDHLGKNCPKTRTCGIRGCRLSHNPLLHDEEKRNRWRKLRVERHCATNQVQPCSASVRSDSNLICESDNITQKLSGRSIENLDSFNDVDNVHSCDGKIDFQPMEQLNRLAMLAERVLPFDLILGGSSRDRSQSLKTGYVTSAPSPEENNEVTHFLDTSSLDSFSDEYIEDRHADMALASDIENMDETIEPSNNEYDLVWPSGGTIDGLNRSIYSPSDEINSETDILDSFVGFESSNVDTAATCDGNIDSKRLDEPGAGEMERHYRIDCGSTGVLSVIENDNDEKSIDSKADNLCSLNSEGRLDDNPVPLSENNSIENTDSVSGPKNGSIDYSWLNTRMDNEVQQLAQKYRNNESTLLDTLNNQINRLDKEISFYETIVPPDSPVEVADQTLEPVKNTTRLMPLHL